MKRADLEYELTLVPRRVQAGIKFLNRHYDGGHWQDWINLARLELQNPCRCVCGQLGGRHESPRTYYRVIEDFGLTPDVAVELGFVSPDFVGWLAVGTVDDIIRYYEALQAEWVKVLARDEVEEDHEARGTHPAW